MNERGRRVRPVEVFAKEIEKKAKRKVKKK